MNQLIDESEKTPLDTIFDELKTARVAAADIYRIADGFDTIGQAETCDAITMPLREIVNALTSIHDATGRWVNEDLNRAEASTQNMLKAALGATKR